MMLFGPGDAADADDDTVLNQYKEAVVRHWRAILAVLLIGGQSYGLQIETEDIMQRDLTNSDRGMDEETRRFMLAVFNARPKKAVWADPGVPYNPEIVRVYSIRRNGRLLPIAISSPTTLAVPAADAWKNLHGLVGWITRKVDEMGNETYAIPDNVLLELNCWEAMALETALKEKLDSLPDDLDAARGQTLRGLLSDYLADARIATNPWSIEALFRRSSTIFSARSKRRTRTRTTRFWAAWTRPATPSTQNSRKSEKTLTIFITICRCPLRTSASKCCGMGPQRTPWKRMFGPENSEP